MFVSVTRYLQRERRQEVWVEERSGHRPSPRDTGAPPKARTTLPDKSSANGQLAPYQAARFRHEGSPASQQHQYPGVKGTKESESPRNVQVCCPHAPLNAVSALGRPLDGPRSRRAFWWDICPHGLISSTSGPMFAPLT